MNHTLAPSGSRESEAAVPYNKTPVFGILQRNGRVYTEIVPDCAKETLQGIIRGRVKLESVIHSGSWRGYDGWLIWATTSIIVSTMEPMSLPTASTISNGIESFRSYAKGRLMKFHGIPKVTFYLHLKECEFRFNYRNQ